MVHVQDFYQVNILIKKFQMHYLFKQTVVKILEMEMRFILKIKNYIRKQELLFQKVYFKNVLKNNQRKLANMLENIME